MKHTKEPKTATFEEKVKEHAIDKLKNLYGIGIEGCALHDILFNEDYFVIGYYPAEQLLSGYGIFQAISKVKEYEKENFGEVSTDLSDSEKVCNMLAYILGGELLNYSKTFRENWDKELTKEMINKIIKEL